MTKIENYSLQNYCRPGISPKSPQNPRLPYQYDKNQKICVTNSMCCEKKAKFFRAPRGLNGGGY